MSGYSKKNVNGYFTVEAAMIMPLVILLTAFLFYLTFFLYNRCILPQDAYILAFRGSALCGKTKEEVIHYMEEDYNNQMGIKYIGLNGIMRDIRVNQKKIEVKLQGKIKFTGKEQTFEAVKAAHRSCPVELIRKVRLVKKLGEKLQDVVRNEYDIRIY